MYNLFKRKKIKEMAAKASEFLNSHYEPEDLSKKSTEVKKYDDGIRYSLKNGVDNDSDSDVRYSRSFSDESIVYENELYYKEHSKPVIEKALKKHPSFIEANAIIQVLDRNINKTFINQVIDYINRKGLNSVDVYKAAHLDRRLFSKMISKGDYQPSKDTCIAICLALKLSSITAEDFLKSAGYALSHSIKRDVVIEFFFENKVYDITLINEVLDDLGMKILGRE